MLDPGHGGIDTGTKGPGGQEEKDIVLNFAQRLRDRIEKTGKYRVLMTRSDDTFVPLGNRVRMARDAGAALFVSIHADSLPRGEGDAQGASIYTLSETATDTAVSYTHLDVYKRQVLTCAGPVRALPPGERQLCDYRPQPPGNPANHRVSSLRFLFKLRPLRHQFVPARAPPEWAAK